MTNAKLSFFADKRTLKWPRSSVDAEGQRKLAVPGRFSSQTEQEYEKYHLKKLVISLLLHPAAVLLSPIVLMLFAILETFILLSISLLLCMYII